VSATQITSNRLHKARGWPQPQSNAGDREKLGKLAFVIQEF
jgi:hypothetical protein